MALEEDPELAELKELVRRNTLLAQDTNHVVHSMRRGQRFRSILSVLWWALILGVSAWSYFTYVQPYVDQILKAYGSEQNLQHQVSGFFGQYFGSSTRQ